VKYFPSVIDSSMLGTLKSCQAKFQKTYLDEWKPKGLSVHLHAGKSFAVGLEHTRNAFYGAGKDSPTSIAIGLGELIRHYGDFQCPADSSKSLERMCGAFEFYWDRYPLGLDAGYPITLPSNRLGVEFTFAHPLPILHPVTGDPLLYSGAMDAIYHYTGDVYIIDEKTTTQLGATWSRQWDLRAQFTGYCWGCREAGIRVAGAIVRGISILKTKYDTQQAIIYCPEWKINRWYEEMLILVNRMIDYWRRDEWIHDLDSSCSDYGGCPFLQCCSSQDETPWLETYFEKRHWDPVARVETLL
jgi:hypothetical protein